MINAHYLLLFLIVIVFVVFQSTTANGEFLLSEMFDPNFRQTSDYLANYQVTLKRNCNPNEIDVGDACMTEGCPAGMELSSDGTLCYPPCLQDYENNGSARCYQVCPPNYITNNTQCTLPADTYAKSTQPCIGCYPPPIRQLTQNPAYYQYQNGAPQNVYSNPTYTDTLYQTTAFPTEGFSGSPYESHDEYDDDNYDDYRNSRNNRNYDYDNNNNREDRERERERERRRRQREREEIKLQQQRNQYLGRGFNGSSYSNSYGRNSELFCPRSEYPLSNTAFPIRNTIVSDGLNIGFPQPVFNPSALGSATPGSCPPGFSLSGTLCLENCPPNYKDEGDRCSRGTYVTDRPSYDRGGGVPYRSMRSKYANI